MNHPWRLPRFIIKELLDKLSLPMQERALVPFRVCPRTVGIRTDKSVGKPAPARRAVLNYSRCLQWTKRWSLHLPTLEFTDTPDSRSAIDPGRAGLQVTLIFELRIVRECGRISCHRRLVFINRWVPAVAGM